MKYLKTKDGRKIPISELSDTNLQNIIKYIKRRSKEGVKVVVSYGGFTCIDSMYYEEEILYGKDAKKHFNYKVYKEEAKKRGL